MHAIRIYKTKGRSLTCEVYPSIFKDDFELSPNEVAPISLTVNPVGNSSRRFVVSASSNFTDSQVLEEIQRFCETLKTMYEL